MVIILSISDEILKSIEIMIESAFNKRKTTEVYIGNISSVNSDGYTVKYSGKEIKIKTECPPHSLKIRSYKIIEI